MILTDPFQLKTLYDSMPASLCSLFLHFFHTIYSPSVFTSSDWTTPHAQIIPLLCSLLALFHNSLDCLYHLETKFKISCNTQVLWTAKTPSTVPTASSQPASADVELGLFFQRAFGIYLHWVLLFRHAAIQHHRNRLRLFFLGASCHIGAWQATNLLVFI